MPRNDRVTDAVHPRERTIKGRPLYADARTAHFGTPKTSSALPGRAWELAPDVN